MFNYITYSEVLLFCIFNLQNGETALDIAMKQDPKSKVTELLKNYMIQVLLVLMFVTLYM